MKPIKQIFAITSVSLALAAASACATEASMVERDDDAYMEEDEGLEPGHAQMRGHGAHEDLDAAGHAAKIQEALGLTDEKTAEVQAIFEELQPKADALHARGKALHEEMRALHEAGDTEGKDAKKQEMRALHEEGMALRDSKMAKLEAVLSPEEVTELRAMFEDHHGKGMHGKHGHKGMHHMMKKDPAEHARVLQEKLGLDDEQTAKAEAVFARAKETFAPMHEKMKAAKEAGELDEDEKAELKAEMKATHEKIKAEVHGELDKILTDEQRAEFEKMKQEHHGKGMRGAHH